MGLPPACKPRTAFAQTRQQVAEGRGGTGLELPYPWMVRNCITLRGQWMYPPHAATLMAGLIRSGLVDLDRFEITAFGLDRANEAVAHAAAKAGPFKMTVIEPRR